MALNTPTRIIPDTSFIAFSTLHNTQQFNIINRHFTKVNVLAISFDRQICILRDFAELCFSVYLLFIVKNINQKMHFKSEATGVKTNLFVLRLIFIPQFPIEM